MAVQKLYPSSPDVSLIDWQVNSGGLDRYDAINEGTNAPDISDYVLNVKVGEKYFDDLYESGTLYDNIKAYKDTVRINLGEMNVWPETTNLKLFAAVNPSTYYGSPAWGIGSFDSQSDFLLHYWNFNDNTGDSITPGGLFLTDTFSDGDIAYTTGKQGNAADFTDGAFLRGSATTTQAPSLRFDSDKSFGGWFYNNGGASTIFTIGNGSARQSVCTLKILDGGVLEYAVYRLSSSGLDGIKVASVTTTAPENEWAFVVCTYNSFNNTIKMSLNAGDFIEASFTPTVLNTTFAYIYIGGHPAVTYFNGNPNDNAESSFLNGYVDEWAIWSKSLTLSEISNIYNSGSGSTYPLDDIIDRKRTVLYDNNGQEIAGISSTNIAASGDLITIDDTAGQLYTFQLDDTSGQLSRNEYDLSNTYIDLQLFTERKYTGIEYTDTSYYDPVIGDGPEWSNANSSPLEEDGVFSSYGMVPTSSQYSDILYLYNYTGLSIPSGSSIQNITAKIITRIEYDGDANYYNSPGNAVVYFDLFPCSTTSTIGNAVATPSWSDGSTKTFFVELDADGITSSDIDNDFGVAARARGVSDGTKYYDVEIDVIELKITYSVPKELLPSIHAAIFTLDVNLDGQTFVDNTVPLYMHNTIVPESTTLYTNSEMPSGDVPLHTWGDDGAESGVSLYIDGLVYDDTPLFIEGHDTEPTGITLHTIGGLYDNSSTDLFLLNTLTPGDTTLYIKGNENESGLVPLNMFAKTSDSGNTPLTIFGGYTTDSNMNLHIEGYGAALNDGVPLFLWSTQNPGIRDITSVFMKSDNSGYVDSNMNLFIQSPDSSDITSNLPLYINNATPSLSEDTTLFIKQSNTESSGDTPLYIKSPGTTEGALPYNTDIPLFIARDQEYNWNSTNLYMHVASGEDENISMFIKSINNTEENTTLYINSKDDQSGDTPMYVSGF